MTPEERLENMEERYALITEDYEKKKAYLLNLINKK